jgi:hypothetical protein
VRVATPSERHEPPAQVLLSGQKPFPQIKWREQRVYDVFDPDGSYRGRVALPLDVAPLIFRRNEIWCSAEDADGAPYVVRYRIVWK